MQRLSRLPVVADRSLDICDPLAEFGDGGQDRPCFCADLRDCSRVVVSWLDHAATDAVMKPSSAMPTTIRKVATRRPSAVTGKRSPYPTVVTVVIAHHRASPNVWMLERRRRRTTCPGAEFEPAAGPA